MSISRFRLLGLVLIVVLVSVVAVSIYSLQQTEMNPVFIAALVPGFLLSLVLHGGIVHDVGPSEPAYLNIAVWFVVLGTAAIFCFRARE